MSDDPLNSSDPAVRDAERERLIQFMHDTAARHMEELRQKTDRAMKNYQPPVPFGGIGSGGVMDS